jgi:hypothetical protein
MNESSPLARLAALDPALAARIDEAYARCSKSVSLWHATADKSLPTYSQRVPARRAVSRPSCGLTARARWSGAPVVLSPPDRGH